MRAVKTLQQNLMPFLCNIHLSRIKTVFWAVQALLNGGLLTLTGLGRSAQGHVMPKHNIKRIDRMLGNTNLRRQTADFYRALCRFVIGGKKHPIVIVDWTGIGSERTAIVAAVPFDGRAIPIYVRVYSSKCNNSSKLETRFLKHLKTILPDDCSPIFVTDAGFRNPWFKAVRENGWDYVGRIIQRSYAQKLGNSEWEETFSLFKRATLTAQDIGTWILAKTNPLQVRFILKTKKATGRKSKKTLAKSVIEARTRANHPWLIATSLKTASAKKVADIYAVRFQIEEYFRDTKNIRFGWSFRHSKSRTNKRLEILLLIATLGCLAITIVGTAAEALGWHRGFQANTVRNVRVLSLFFLGKNVIDIGRDKTLPQTRYTESIEILKGKLVCLTNN